MRIALYPADLGGCGHYRLIWAGRELAREGFDVVVHEPIVAGTGETWVATMRDDADGPHLVDLLPPPADVVVLQRPLRRFMAEAVPILQSKGIVVVVEVDDDFATIHPSNTAWAASNPQLSPFRNWEHLASACRQADLVTVSTPALAKRYGGHGRVVVIPNLVPRRYLDVPRYRGDKTVAWSGEVHSHPNDLQQVGTGVRDAMRDTGASLRVIGSGRGVCKRLGVDTGRAAGWQPLGHYPEMMAQATVGIVPLDLTAFNEAKSWLKGLEFAAVGVPFVASPTQQYRALAGEGLGDIAAKPKEWRARLRHLLTDDDAREELSDWRRRQVEGRYVLEDRVELWLDAWMAAARRKVAA